MTSLLLAALLAHPENHCSEAQARPVVRAAEAAAARHKLPPSLLLAILLAETGCRDVVARGRGKGRQGADVGYFQVHCPGPAARRERCIRQYRPLKANAARATYILALGRERCRRAGPRPWYCRIHFAGRYNPGSRRWLRRMLRIHQQLLRHMARAPSS